MHEELIFADVSHFLSIQANNAYIFPGFGLGLIISGAIRVHDDMLLAACKCKIKFKVEDGLFFYSLFEPAGINFLVAIETN